MARSLAPGFGRNSCQNFEDSMARSLAPAFKTRWQGHPLQALVEPISKTQALKTRWQGHPLQASVETMAKTQ